MAVYGLRWFCQHLPSDCGAQLAWIYVGMCDWVNLSFMISNRMNDSGCRCTPWGLALSAICLGVCCSRVCYGASQNPTFACRNNCHCRCRCQCDLRCVFAGSGAGMRRHHHLLHWLPLPLPFPGAAPQHSTAQRAAACAWPVSMKHKCFPQYRVYQGIVCFSTVRVLWKL